MDGDQRCYCRSFMSFASMGCVSSFGHAVIQRLVRVWPGASTPTKGLDYDSPDGLSPKL